jgi:hypothetical protein
MYFLLTVGAEPWMVMVFCSVVLLSVVFAFYGMRRRKIKYLKLEIENLKKEQVRLQLEKNVLQDEVTELRKQKDLLF